MTASVQSYRDLVVWQKSMGLAVEAYRLTRLMPKYEEFRMTSQIIRAAASVPAISPKGTVEGPEKTMLISSASRVVRSLKSRLLCCW